MTSQPHCLDRERPFRVVYDQLYCNYFEKILHYILQEMFADFAKMNYLKKRLKFKKQPKAVMMQIDRAAVHATVRIQLLHGF